MDSGTPLPYNTDAFSSIEDYVQSLLGLVCGNDFFRTLCGGVHILDFFTSDPPLYDKLLPIEWRSFFAEHTMMDLLHLYLREDLETLALTGSADRTWRDGPFPPASLIQYIQLIRKHLLDREVATSQCALNRSQKKLARHVSIGMKTKKLHEVGIFASYMDSLANDISAALPDNQAISHLIDFGSGQGYLGRALASEPYNRNIVAIESKIQNADRARDLDVKAELLEKHRLVRNKKAFRAGMLPPDPERTPDSLPTPPPESKEPSEQKVDDSLKLDVERPGGSKGTVQHVSHRIESGDLTDVMSNIHDSDSQKFMVMSLHSCGNLVHYGLRSLTANPRVQAVAMVGCCYNLITERLGPATYKLPNLRTTTRDHPRLEREGCAYDPAGFPMSQRFCEYGEEGVRLNITARMMAVQAPTNWGERESNGFFNRHFFRALLQRIFLDRGVVGPPSSNVDKDGSPMNSSSSGGTPIILGSLRKSCYDSFLSYVRGALDKLHENEIWQAVIREKMGDITDEEILTYEEDHRERQKDLSIVWSLMAFSAGAIEAAIVVDRWLWLKEQEEVKDAWVEAVFDYRLSPRNLVVVGVKK